MVYDFYNKHFLALALIVYIKLAVSNCSLIFFTTLTMLANDISVAQIYIIAILFNHHAQSYK